MPRPKIAAIVTEHRPNSHGQHLVDRFLWGYSWQGRHHHPPMDLVSIYVDQLGEGDLAVDRAKRCPTMKIYPTIVDALTLGTGKLAVDGVVVIGEQGRNPRNEKGQMLWPYCARDSALICGFSRGVSVRAAVLHGAAPHCRWVSQARIMNSSWSQVILSTCSAGLK